MSAIVAFLPHTVTTVISDIVIICLGILNIGGHIYYANLRKKRLPSTLNTILPPPPLPPGAVRVTYHSTQSSAWRCELYTMTHRRQTALDLVAFPLFLFVVGLLFVVALSGGVPGPVAALTDLVLLLLGWFILMSVVLWLMMRKRFPRPDSVRVCTTTLTAEGYADITPDKLFSVQWREVTDIREIAGDVFLWRSGAGCNIVNREAFQDRRQAQEFYAAAVALWKGRPADWPYATVIDHTCLHTR